MCIVGFLREELKFTSERESTLLSECRRACVVPPCIPVACTCCPISPVEDLITAIHKDIEDARVLTADPANQEYKKHSFFSN